MCLCCRAKLYFPLPSIISKLAEVPRRITHLLMRLAVCRSGNSALTSSTLEKALYFFTMISFEQSQKKIFKIDEKEQLEIIHFLFSECLLLKNKVISLLYYCQKPSSPFISSLQFTSFIKMNFGILNSFHSDFHYKGAPRETSCCWNRSWEARHSETLLFSPSWCHFLNSLCSVFLLYLFLPTFSDPTIFQKFLTCFEEVSSSAA